MYFFNFVELTQQISLCVVNGNMNLFLKFLLCFFLTFFPSEGALQNLQLILGLSFIYKNDTLVINGFFDLHYIMFS